MIYLRIKDYCQNCPNFDADVNKIFTNSGGIVSTEIRCSHVEECDQIRHYLEKSIKKPTCTWSDGLGTAPDGTQCGECHPGYAERCPYLKEYKHNENTDSV